MAATSASKAVRCPPILRAPSCSAVPLPRLSVVTTQPRPPETRKEPSVQAWQVRPRTGGAVHAVLRLKRGLTSSTRRPSLIRRWLEASVNHLGILCLLESSAAMQQITKVSVVYAESIFNI